MRKVPSAGLVGSGFLRGVSASSRLSFPLFISRMSCGPSISKREMAISPLSSAAKDTDTRARLMRATGPPSGADNTMSSSNTPAGASKETRRGSMRPCSLSFTSLRKRPATELPSCAYRGGVATDAATPLGRSGPPDSIATKARRASTRTAALSQDGAIAAKGIAIGLPLL